MPLILPGNVASATAGAFSVDNSVRFNRADAPRFHKTPGGAGNRKTFTFSMWIKRSGLSSYQPLWESVGNWADFKSDDTLRVGINATGGSSTHRVTNRLFRDVSAWYHLVFRVDTTQGTAADRLRIYVNGVEETSMGTTAEVAEDVDTDINNTSVHDILTDGDGTRCLDGYAAEIVLLDGTSAAPTEFGEFDEDSPTIWKPKKVSGLNFGTNGFYLDFKDSANLGNDASGGTDLTEVNLDATDQATDTPTNNFCTWNPLRTSDASGPGDSVFSEGNTELDDGSGDSAVWGTMGVSTGKWYFEYRMKHSANVNTYVGARSFDESTQIALDPESDGYIDGFTFKFGNDGTGSGGSGSDAYVNGYQNGTRATIDSGTHIQDDQILGVNMDLDNGKVYLQIDGADIYSGNSVCDLRTGTGVFFTPYVKHTSSSIDYIQLNTGGASPYTLSSAVNDDSGYGNFEYAPKSGHLALCTKNLGSDGG